MAWLRGFPALISVRMLLLMVFLLLPFLSGINPPQSSAPITVMVTFTS